MARVLFITARLSHVSILFKFVWPGGRRMNKTSTSGWITLNKLISKHDFLLAHLKSIATLLKIYLWAINHSLTSLLLLSVRAVRKNKIWTTTTNTVYTLTFDVILGIRQLFCLYPIELHIFWRKRSIWSIHSRKYYVLVVVQ